MRLFIAIDLEEKLREAVKRIENEIKKTDTDIRFVEPENLHLTLKFLGEVSEDKIPLIEKRISKSLLGCKPFNVSIGNLGYFGSPGHIKTLWLDIKRGKDEVMGLINSLKPLDSIRRDDYEPSPHLTIGRVKSGKNRERLLKEMGRLKDVKVGEMDVKSVKLKSSILTGSGPSYSDVKVFELSPVQNPE